MDLKELRRSADERERGRDWSGFVDACRAVADHPAAAGDAISYLQKAAVASEQHLRDPDGALAIWRRVAEIDPKNRYASAALRRLHLARGDWASALAVAREHGAVRDCVRLFERALEGREGRDRLELLIHLGRLHEEIGERSSAPRALRAYQQALEIAPGNPDAAAALARLYDPARDAAPLAAVLWTLVEQAGSDGEAIELLRRIAALATGPLGDPEQALTAQRAIVDRGGADVRALAGLVRQHQEQEDWAEVDRLRRQIAEALAAEPSPDERAAYVELAGRILEIGDHIEPIEGREAWCARALDIDPDCEMLAPAAELLSTAAEEPAARARLAARAAALWRRRGDHGRAFEALRRAVAVAGDRDDALDALEEMAAIEDRWDEVAEVLREIAGQPLSLDEQIGVRLRLGRIYAEQLRDVERAIKTFRRVSDLSPHGHGLRELARLYARQGRTEDEVAALRRLRPLAELPERREIDVRLAELERDQVDDEPALDLEVDPPAARAEPAANAVAPAPKAAPAAPKAAVAAAPQAAPVAPVPKAPPVAPKAPPVAPAAQAAPVAPVPKAPPVAPKAAVAPAAQAAPVAPVPKAAPVTPKAAVAPAAQAAPVAPVPQAAPVAPAAQAAPVAPKAPVAPAATPELAAPIAPAPLAAPVPIEPPVDRVALELKDALEGAALALDDALGDGSPLAEDEVLEGAALAVDDGLEGSVPVVESALVPVELALVEPPVDRVALELKDALEGAALALDDALGDGPAAPLGDGPTAPLDVGPAAPLGDGPAAPLDVGPTAPLDVGPTAALDVGPTAALDVGPAAPLDVGPTAAADDPTRGEGQPAFDEMMSRVMSAEELDRALLRSFEALAEKSGRWDDFLVSCEHLARVLEARDPAGAVDLWIIIAVAHEVRRDDTASALLAAERASELAPDRLDLVVRRMELHRRRNEWAECDQLMARLSETG